VGQVRAEKQAVDGHDSHGGHGYVSERDSALIRGKNGEPLVGRDQTVVYQVAVYFP
jgi:hypothetical protein